jgi:hypothetical protein
MSIQVPKRTAALRENGLFEKSNRAGQDITFIPHRPAGFEKGRDTVVFKRRNESQ